MMNVKRWVRVVAPAMLCALLQACGHYASTAHVRDVDSPALGARLSVRPEAWARESGSRGGVLVAHQRYRAESAQSMVAGQVVDLGAGNPQVTGPDALRNRARVEQWELAYLHTFAFGSHFELEPWLGVAHLRFDFDVEPMVSAARPSVRYRKVQFSGGIAPRWRFNDLLAVEFRYQGIGGSDIFVANKDIGVILHPHKNMGLWLGYSLRESGGRLGHSSDMNVEARGPAVNVVFDF